MGDYFGTSVAVTAGGRGDVTPQTLWRTERTPNRLGSGVIYQGHIYVLNTNGIMECLNLKTGEVQFSERVRGRGPKQESWSSMILAGDRIYIPNQSGETIVLRANPKFELLGINALDGILTNNSPTPQTASCFCAPAAFVVHRQAPVATPGAQKIPRGCRTRGDGGAR